MPAWHPVLRLGHAAVYDEHLVTAAHQRLGDPPTDEPRTADDGNAHGHPITPQDRPGRCRISRSAGSFPQKGFDLLLNVGCDVAVSQRALDDTHIMSGAHLPKYLAGG